MSIKLRKIWTNNEIFKYKLDKIYNYLFVGVVRRLSRTYVLRTALQTFMKMGIDKKDMKIIAELKKNSRATVRDIAKSTNIRPSTVSKDNKAQERRSYREIHNKTQ